MLAEESGLLVHTIPHERSGFRTWKAPLPHSPELHPGPSYQPPADHLLVTASFGRILPNSLLNLFLPSRRLNVHPSLLPWYRGAAPIQHALMDSQQETGVCVIEMTEWKKGIDSGAIWASERMTIPGDASFPELRDSLARAGGDLLVSVLRDILAGRDTRRPQVEDSNAPRAPLISGEHSRINFKTTTATRIVATHRAISHQKPMTTLLKTGRTLQLHNPSVLVDGHSGFNEELTSEGAANFCPPTGTLIVRCAGNTYLSVPQVRQQDRSLLKAKDWWNGVKPELRLHEGNDGPVQFIPFSS